MRCSERRLAVLHAQLLLAHWPRRALSHTTKICARSAIDDNSPLGLKARPHANRAGVLIPSDAITLVTGNIRWRATEAKKIDVAKYGNLHNHHRWRQSTSVKDRALFSTLDHHNFPLTAATRMVDPPLESYGAALDLWRRGCFATSGCHSEKASKATCTRSRPQTKGHIYMNQVSSPFLQTCTGDKKNKQRATIIYTTEREDTIIDSESRVNVHKWHACVNMSDTLLSNFV